MIHILDFITQAASRNIGFTSIKTRRYDAGLRASLVGLSHHAGATSCRFNVRFHHE